MILLTSFTSSLSDCSIGLSSSRRMRSAPSRSSDSTSLLVSALSNSASAGVTGFICVETLTPARS